MCSASGESPAPWKLGLSRSENARTNLRRRQQIHTLEDTVPFGDVRATSFHLSVFQGPARPSVLPICTWCFPQLLPNCLVSWIFYCNFLCLIYFKVAKCFHKERAVKLFRNEKDIKLPFLLFLFWEMADNHFLLKKCLIIFLSME